MSVTRATVLAAVSTLMFGATEAVAATEINVRPAGAYGGEVVRVFGTADGCAPGNTVTLISRAFSRRQEFAGVPAITDEAGANGRFSKRTRIPRRRRPGRYGITGRCGGGNLGVTAYLRIRRSRRCGSVHYDGPGEADEVSFIAIRTRRVTCRNARRLLRRIAAAGDNCPAGWRCAYPLNRRARFRRGLKSITFSPAG
jgi:hypothetical protein